MITKRNIFRRIAWLGTAAALFLASSAMAAEEKQWQLSEKVSEAMQKMKPLQDQKNFAGMMQLVDGQLKQVAPNSYDAGYLLDIKGRIFLTTEKLAQAIDPWEKALNLSLQHGYLDNNQEIEMAKILSQLVFMQAVDLKDRKAQQAMVERALGFLDTYKKLVRESRKKPDPETYMLEAQILYAQATADPNNVNNELLNRARGVIETAMLDYIRPKESFYLLLLAILQQQNDLSRSAEVMELLLKQYPQKKDVWPMLFSAYVNLAGSAQQDSKEQREFYVRAINTLERAQKLGFMNTPRDNYNLFTLYVGAGELSMATEMLHTGMKKGAIESTLNNWRVLGSYYQMAHKELQAISALQEASKLFPKEGSIDLLIGQIYQQMDRIKEANAAYSRAIAKGNLGDRPHQAYLYHAYTSLELGELDVALKSIEQAAASPGGGNDPQVKAVREGIEAMVAEREAARIAKEEAENKKKKGGEEKETAEEDAEANKSSNP